MVNETVTEQSGGLCDLCDTWTPNAETECCGSRTCDACAAEGCFCQSLDIPDVESLDWPALGRTLHAAGDIFPPVAIAYEFLLDNPDRFGHDQWPDNMPANPPAELIAAYEAEVK